MASSLYERLGHATPRVPSDLLAAARGDPTGVYERMLATNPAFARFVADNRGKTPQQIAAEHGVDLSRAIGMIGGARGQ